jgi:predicted NBD/HSP70 family sugar kinase
MLKPPAQAPEAPALRPGQDRPAKRPISKPNLFGNRQIASNRTPRQINRNLLFHLIRTRQPISRADLARVSGLQRSTVSLIVEELVASRWVIERISEGSVRGRRPTFLFLNDKRAVVAVDIHPRQTTVALSDIAGNIVAQRLVPLPSEAQPAIRAITGAVQGMIQAHPEHSVEGIGISLPGRADLQLNKLIFAPNLHWPVMAIRSRLQRSFRMRLEIENVANACALAEVWYGNNDGMHDLVAVNVSEGIGTGIFANGQLLRGSNGMAGEFGHVQVDPDGPLCSCGNSGCWEIMASNRAALRYYQALSPGGSARTFPELLKLAQNKDPDATKALHTMADYLGRGIRMIATALAPSEIIIVGDIAGAWHMVGSRIEAQGRHNSPFQSPSIRPAPDGSTARLRSAVALVMNEDFL